MREKDRSWRNARCRVPDFCDLLEFGVHSWLIRPRKCPMKIQLKRAYEPALKSDGTRVLVDRLWPRGLAKAKAKIDLWLKEIAPSTELRKWFHAAVKDADWKEFRLRYQAELKDHAADLELLRSKARHAPVTLIYSSRDRERNHAIILKEILAQPSTRRSRPL